jgi:hypothetical protein
LSTYALDVTAWGAFGVRNDGLAVSRNFARAYAVDELETAHSAAVCICEVLMADASTRETSSLIGSDKVEGTAVYGTDQNKIGTVQRVMIDKLSGKVAYAVISFGGFLGVGEDYYPVPWSTLKYDTNLGGYVTGVTVDSLKGAPSYSSSSDWEWSRDNDRRVYQYYKAEPFWG